MIVQLAMRIARAAHAGQVDRAGVDYFDGHLSAVAAACESDIEKAVAFLHDAIEDCDIDAIDLIDMLVLEGASYEEANQIVSAVVAMSKIDGENYNEYLNRVKMNPISRVVKLADLNHNSDLNRLPVVSEADVERVVKYARAIDFLSAV